MQPFSNPEVFLCPLFNAPGMPNKKPHIRDLEEQKTVFFTSTSELSSHFTPSSNNSPGINPPPPFMPLTCMTTRQKVVVYKEISKRTGKSLMEFAIDTHERQVELERKKVKELQKFQDRIARQQEQEARMFLEYIHEDSYDA